MSWRTFRASFFQEGEFSSVSRVVPIAARASARVFGDNGCPFARGALSHPIKATKMGLVSSGECRVLGYFSPADRLRS